MPKGKKKEFNAVKTIKKRKANNKHKIKEEKKHEKIVDGRVWNSRIYWKIACVSCGFSISMFRKNSHVVYFGVFLICLHGIHEFCISQSMKYYTPMKLFSSMIYEYTKFFFSPKKYMMIECPIFFIINHKYARSTLLKLIRVHSIDML